MLFKKSWQQQGSFKGAVFFTATANDEYARRGPLHEFPQRDGGYFEDLGASPPSFTLAAYVTELSPGGYAAARDKLIKACRTSGVGELVHPYYGNLQVVCTGFSVSHDKTANGIAQFSLTFVEQTLELSSPASQTDAAASIQSLADSSLSAAIEDFAANYNLQNSVDFLDAAAGDLATGLEATLLGLLPAQSVLGPTQALLGSRLSLLGLGQMLFAGKVDPSALLVSLAPGLLALLRKPAALGRQIAGLNGLTVCAAPDYNAAYASQKSLWNYGQNLPPVPAYTANRKQQAQNQTAFCGLVRQSATIECARCVPYLEFSYRGEAESVRDELCDRLDQEAESTKSDTLYQSLERLRQVVVSDVARRATDLARLSSYTPAATLPALAISYDLYETLAYEADLVGRNKVTHPGFVPGGYPLEILKP